MANYQYVVGVIASLLVYVFLYYNNLVRRQKKMSRTCSMEFKGHLGADAPEVIIVGAGVAGAALAYALGKDGRRVHVIERDLKEQDTFAGEGLLPGGYLKLIELGLEDCVEKIDAQRVLGWFLHKGEKSVKLSFPLEKYQSNVSGKNFHHARFVQRLREKAASLPNINLEQGTVTSLIEENGTIKGVQYKKSCGEELTANAPLTIVCDGGFSKLRRSLCYSKVDIPSYFVGFLLENCKLAHANYGHIVMADPSPVLFYPISSTEIRCLVDVTSQKVPSISNGEMAHFLKTLVAPKVPPELHTAFISAIEKPNNIRISSIRIMAAAPRPTPGAILMGDSFNMRHAISGGGMTVALSDVVVLRNLLRPLNSLSNAFAICKYLESFYILRKPMASTINTLASILHKIISDPKMEDLQHAFMGYLSLGGVFSNGPSALISGLCPNSLSLAFHFFALVMYGFGRLLLPFPTSRRIWFGVKFIWVASSILFPLIKSEGVRQMFFPLTVPAYYRAPPSEA